MASLWLTVTLKRSVPKSSLVVKLFQKEVTRGSVCRHMNALNTDYRSTHSLQRALLSFLPIPLPFRLPPPLLFLGLSRSPCLRGSPPAQGNGHTQAQIHRRSADVV